MVELLVGLTVGGLITGAALAITLSSQRIFKIDQTRTTINQNLRSGMDLLGIDVRQAGERLPYDIPALEIVNGGGGAADQLLLRRHLLDPVLPLCKTINAGTAADTIFVAEKKVALGPKVAPGCSPVPDSDADGWPDNMQAWRDFRQASGKGWVWAYIYNPTTHAGEFFQYDDEDNSNFHIHRLNPGLWANDYDVTDNARVYILEQLTFRLQGDILQALSLNGSDSTLNLVNHIADFQVRAFLDDGTVLESMTTSSGWSNLQSVEVTLVGTGEFAGRKMERTLVTHFFPRNVLSLTD